MQRLLCGIYRSQALHACLQEHLGFASPAEQAQLAGVKARLSRQLLPYRDSNGFRKLLVLLTKPGARMHDVRSLPSRV